MRYIKKVISKENYVLEVIIDNGNSITLSFEDKLGTIRFGLLRDKDFFKQVTTNGSFILWGNQVELSIIELFEFIQK